MFPFLRGRALGFACSHVVQETDPTSQAGGRGLSGVCGSCVGWGSPALALGSCLSLATLGQVGWAVVGDLPLVAHTHLDVPPGEM